MRNLLAVFRATLFYLGLGLLTLLYLPVATLSFVLPYRARYTIVSTWAPLNLWWLRITCGLNHIVEGLENLPAEPAVVLCKHQSAWETLALNLLFRPQVWVLKRELLRIPVFGWGLSALQPIAINRKAGRSAIKQVVEQGTDRLNKGCWVVVFPEGTRVAPGQQKRYRLGGAILAHETGRCVVPVAHNAGDYWPRRSYCKKPGTIRLVIGPLIDTEGKKAADINREAQGWIEQQVATLREQSGHAQSDLDRHQM